MVYLYYNIFGFNKRTPAFIINFSIKIYYLPQHPCYLFIYIIILNFPINLFFTVWITSIIILPWDVPSFDSSCCLYSFMPYGNYSAPGHYVVVSRRRSAARRPCSLVSPRTVPETVRTGLRSRIRRTLYYYCFSPTLFAPTHPSTAYPVVTK